MQGAHHASVLIDQTGSRCWRSGPKCRLSETGTLAERNTAEVGKHRYEKQTQQAGSASWHAHTASCTAEAETGTAGERGLIWCGGNQHNEYQVSR